jgi:carbonic anhydrase
MLFRDIRFQLLTHLPADNKLLVVGLLFDVTQSKNKQSQTIRALADMSSKIGTKGQNVTINQYHNLDLAPIINAIDKTKLQTYPGSLTTPPCTEGVTWVVNPIPLEIDVQTFNAFKKIMKHNSRLLQGPPGSKNTLQQV